MSERVVITYGTFDLFHVGHLRLLSRLKELGDRLIVGVSTDEFNQVKGKRSYIPFEHRSEIVSALRVVDLVIPESSWDQKPDDIRKLGIDVLGMGSDWEGKFDDFQTLCEVVYLPRTEDVSSTHLRSMTHMLRADEVESLKSALDAVSELLERLS